MVKESIKRSRSFLKTFAASLHDAQKTQKAEMKKGGCPAAAATSGCPMSAHHAPKLEAKLAAKERREERREERQEKRQEKHEKRQERREEERREKRENPREQFSWMDIFTKYVDHFANVAADHVRVSTSDSAEQTPHPEFEMVFDPAEFAKVMDRCMNMHNSRRPSDEMMSQAGGSQESPRDSEQAPADKPASAPSTSQAASQEAPTTPQAETQAPAAPQVAPRTATTPQAPAQAAATSQAPAQAPATPLVPTQAPATPQAPTTAPVTPQVAPTPVQPVEVAKSDSPDNSSVSSAEGTIRETSPDKSAEGWTMINAEKGN